MALGESCEAEAWGAPEEGDYDSTTIYCRVTPGRSYKFEGEGWGNLANYWISYSQSINSATPDYDLTY